MRCTNPRTVGFLADGKTISWSPKKYSPEYATFQLPCSKCLSCRLEYATQWAIRCVHEAAMHEQNSFITLTYSDEKLQSTKLKYLDFQLFVKRLRKKIFTDFLNKFGKHNYELLEKEERKKINDKFKISIFVTGEYGDKKKRPHWHALIFNWTPSDLKYKYTNHNGDKVYSSLELDSLWSNGITEVGSVTMESAGYCARYAAKKLVHGKDQDHDYHPISKKSSKTAIGKTWLEKYHSDVFNYGHIILPDGNTTPIPRYYEKWLKENKPTEWLDYTTRVKLSKIKEATQKEQQTREKEKQENWERLNNREPLLITRSKTKEIIQEKKFLELQKNLKL